MQGTTSLSEKENNWLAQVGLVMGVFVCLLLFGVAIGRMGLLNGLLGAETAVSLPNSITYTTKEMRYGQTDLHIQAEQEITLQLLNYDLYAHSFDIEELDIHVQMPANGQSITQLTVSEPGIYTIYCGIPGHREAGMIATLVVEP